MKKILLFTMILMALAACTTDQTQTIEIAATDLPQQGLANPASIFCEQNGNKLEIQTAADGSQYGVCVFPDGSTCDEWAYFREECGPLTLIEPLAVMTAEANIEASGGYMAPGTSEEIADWWGVIKRTESGAQYDDYFERQDLGQNFIFFGIDSLDQNVKTQIEAGCDSGKIVHLYGTLLSNVNDYNGSQILVNRIEIEG